MTGQHSPGYDAAYQKDRRAANKRLREAHPEEYQRYLDEERAKRTGP